MLTTIAALLLAPAPSGAPATGRTAAGQTTRQTTTRTTRTTMTYRDPGERVTVNAGDRVRIVLTNPDARPWTAAKPIQKTVVLVTPNGGRGNTSTFEYTTSVAARSTLEFRHPSGARRQVKLTVEARTPARAVPPKVVPKTVDGKANAKVAYIVGSDGEDKTFVVPRGQLFEIRLSENGTTGYAWRPEPWPTDIVALKSSTYVPDEPENPRPGSGGTRVYRLKAIAPGTADVTLVYERPWNKERGDQFHFVLEVR